ncbi:Pheromone a factor receptor [Tolypocladium ophioglossoides CBS 100239]|uniref:Pheromone a factor receptor n=1 Tax=Tolypocladium ophioglossoides (strain CBS 100239) TaxID=1163406 RepID=A0A0L0NLE5_TOLOC|nr:Pheromone a factor receptor [Tolypocladium ophioglossoides CBS 100239]
MESSSPNRLFGRDDALIFRVPSEPPYVTTSLTANLVVRVLLALLGNMVCLVPLRLLYRNGEFAAVVFILNVMAINLETVVMSLTWRDNDVQSWWPGYGLCDVDAYFHNASQALYATCLLAIMRNLAEQVGMLRANPLTVREKRKRNLIQALIMFPLPILQLGMTWIITTQRYVVGTLVGCTWMPHASWPNLVFYILPPVVLGFITTVYAIQVYFRFREVAKTTQTALSTSRTANRRSQRTRRRLYLMVTSILVPFFPVVIALAVVNVLANRPLLPFSYDAVHDHPFPRPWNTITFIPSSMINWMYMNNCYIPILTVVPIFVFFGMTKDAMNQYRLAFLFVGLGDVFPRLKEEYNPDRGPSGGSSLGSGQTATVTGFPAWASKLNSSTSSRQLTSVHSTSTTGLRDAHAQATDLAADLDMESGLGHAVREPESAADACPPNPFPFRTRLRFPIPFKLLFFKSKTGKKPKTQGILPLESFHATTPPHASRWNSLPGNTQAHAWADEEARLFNTPADTGDLGSSKSGAVRVDTTFTREILRASIHRQQRHPGTCHS